MALGFEELTVYFKIVGVIIGIWALILVFRGFKHLSNDDDKRTWFILLYAVFMFFLAKIFDGMSLVLGDRIDEEFLRSATMMIEVMFFALIFYALYMKIKNAGALPIFIPHFRPEASKGEMKTPKVIKGHSYIAETTDTDYIFKHFYELVNHGYEGLIFTREFPDRLQNRYGFKETPIIWISREGDKENLRPSDLERMNHTIQDFLKKSTNGLILIDGFEYLSTYNGFSKLVKLVHDLRDSVAIHNAGLILVIHPGTMSERELNYLKRDLLNFGVEE